MRITPTWSKRASTVTSDADNQRPGVGLGGPRTGRRASTLDDHDRLLTPDPPRHPGEAARIAERLDVEESDLGALVLLPVLEEVVRRHVGAIADRCERRDAEAAILREVDQRQAEGAALRREAHVAAGRHRRREGGVEAAGYGGVEDPQAVRADSRIPASRQISSSSR